MRVILSSNPYRDKGLRAALEARRILERAGAETVLCLPFRPRKGDRLELPRQLPMGELEEELTRADLLVCFGGDGTILHAARDATLHDVPVLGVNMGSVGFMAELERGELPVLADLVKNGFSTEDRMMLDVRVLRGDKQIFQDLALNDAVCSKGSVARVAELEVWADGTRISQISGDGVIVATPTGSTAYSMSAGGPIVEPSAKNFLITPICAHAMLAKSIVVAPSRVITVRVGKVGRHNAFLSVDGGRAFRLSVGDEITVKSSQKATRLVRLKKTSFFEILNKKFIEKMR